MISIGGWHIASLEEASRNWKAYAYLAYRFPKKYKIAYRIPQRGVVQVQLFAWEYRHRHYDGWTETYHCGKAWDWNLIGTYNRTGD